MNSINLYEGINLVCFNKEDTIAKTLDPIKEKVTTISSLKNNIINSSIYMNIGNQRMLIGGLQNFEYNLAYYITCNDSATLTYSKSYIADGNIKLYTGNNLIGFSNTKDISINKVLNYSEINTVSSLENNTINASININNNYIGSITKLKENLGYIINTTDSVTIDIYKNDLVNMSVKYDKIHSTDSVMLKIYKANVKIVGDNLLTDSNQNLLLSQNLDSSVFNFSIPHGIYNITFDTNCEHTECGTNHGNYRINVGDSIVVNQNNYTKENTTTIFARYDSTFIHSSLTYEDYIINMEEKMKNINELFPNISKYYSLGKSQDGNYDLWVMEISGDLSKTKGKPYLRYIGNMHGNEPSGRALIIWFIEWLCDEYYEGNSRVVNLLNKCTLQFLPTMNPWGFHQTSRNRYNSRGYDLNRNFPDQYVSLSSYVFEAETQLVMNWNLNSPQVILSGNFHEGAKIMSYPYDGDASMQPGLTGNENLTEDSIMYKIIAKEYSQNMYPKLSLTNSYPRKEHGIINGADWYTLYGGMQDWEYLTYDIMSITIELSVGKNLDPSYLDDLKYENLSSDGKIIDGGAMLAYFESAFQGIHGVILDTSGNPISEAIIQIYQNGQEFGSSVKSKEEGDFYKLLPYGSYIIKVEKTGYDTYVNGTFIQDVNSNIQNVTTMTITLITSN